MYAIRNSCQHEVSYWCEVQEMLHVKKWISCQHNLFISCRHEISNQSYNGVVVWFGDIENWSVLHVKTSSFHVGVKFHACSIKKGMKSCQHEISCRQKHLTSNRDSLEYRKKILCWHKISRWHQLHLTHM